MRQEQERYQRARRNAITRGIRWELTFEEWRAIWRASGYARWCGQGQYCMARRNGTGAFRADRVDIIPVSQAAKNYWRGPRGPQARQHNRAVATSRGYPVDLPEGSWPSRRAAARALGISYQQVVRRQLAAES